MENASPSFVYGIFLLPSQIGITDAAYAESDVLY